MSLPNTRYGAKAICEMLAGGKKVFFCGIGGIHMSSLAHIAALMNCKVSGSDRRRSPLTERLEKEGAVIYYSHNAENIQDAELFVYTVAISPDNPEYLEAQRRGIPTVSRADFLGFVMSAYTNRVGISGAHGKSTCVSMAAHIFAETGMDPTVISGAEYAGMGGAYRIGGKKDFIFESCEYMDNFLSFCPNLAVILNIEFDHADYFADLEAVRASFASYARLSIANGGRVLANGDDENTRIALEGIEHITFGIGENNDYRAVDIKIENGNPRFTVICPDGEKYAVSLPVAGEHNVYNALASFAALDICGGNREKAAKAFDSFMGAKRRMEFKKEVRGAKIFEDYAHHPTEIRATIRAARMAQGGRVICVFQPHTYSRTAELLEDFATALGEADKTYLLPIYSARETDTLGVSSELLASKIDGAVAAESFEALAKILNAELKEGDTLLITGAGDVIALTDLIK
ncbi:MAG: UDP-N-acetylmuramate--L-alanine ligase [Ruminococcaceae bacterium]|nr:UDP-N-acetylmuramate--L-alanine ligase [Oscillospiraceae bacterium]